MDHTSSSSQQDGEARKKNETGPYSHYTNKLTATLNEQRKENQFCDIVINVGGRQFPAHKGVLAASSRYFQSMFKHGFKESSEAEIKIEGDPDIFEVLLDYAYTGKMKIVPKIAYDILEMGCYMQFRDICQYCSQFMDLSKNSAKSWEDIQMADVFKMYQLAQEQSDLADVVERSMKYMSENIAEVKDKSYFLQTAEVSFFDDFLSRKDLSSEREEAEVLELVVNWLKHDWTKRHQHTIHILQQVRLGHVPEARLKELLDGKILETPGCQQLLEKVLGLIHKLQASEVSKTDLTSDYPDLFATRSTVTVPIALTHGRLGRHSCDDEFCYFCYFDLVSKKWLQLKNFATLSHIATLIVANRSLYAIASFEEDDDDNLDGKELFKYDSEKNQWQAMPSMPRAREANTFAVISTNRFIYVIGGIGWADCGRMGCVGRFDLENQVWQRISCLPQDFEWYSVIEFEGTIIAYGEGARFNQENVHCIIAAYDAVNNTWHTAHNEEARQLGMMTSKPALFIHQDNIYLIRYEQLRNGDNHRSNESHSPLKPKVVLLSVRFMRNTVTITREEEIAQDLIPANNVGAFRIGNEVFINMFGYIQKEDAKITPGQVADVNFDAWKHAQISSLNVTNRNSNTTDFTIDMKKLCGENWANQGSM